ncbi:MAG TPA: hypothetical protein VOA64_00275 [Candidatus Dormibacteraeota bacterium]|nr:hypothetical protein [Candidatus Dormibacteraeota bacterium]
MIKLKPRKQELFFNGDVYHYSLRGGTFAYAVIMVNRAVRHDWEIVKDGWRKTVTDSKLVADLEVALRSE